MLDDRTTAFVIFIVLAATIIGAWIFQWAGYAPCPLCLMQRWPYYAGIPLAAFAWRMAPGNRAPMAVLGIVLLGSAIFGAYHAGVEWKFWPGPGTCEGELGEGLPQLGNDPVVGCDEAAIRILGLSLAGWNAVITGALAALAFASLRKR